MRGLIKGACLLAGLCWPFAVQARPMTPKQQQEIQRFYPSGQLLMIEGSGFDLRQLSLAWISRQPRPNLILVYHKAVVYAERGLTQHFSLTLRHYPRQRTVGADFRCQKNERLSEFRHADFGPYVICSQPQRSVSQVPGMSREPVDFVSARILPRAGNRMPHAEVYLTAFESDLLPLARSLHSARSSQ